MKEIRLYHFAKASVMAFILYVCWFRYVFGEKTIILYLTGAVSIGTMVFDMLRNNESYLGVFPFGVAVNIIMCVYSVLTGLFVAVNTNFLLSQLKSYLCYSLVCLVICYVVHVEKSIDWLVKFLVFVSVVCCLQVLLRGHYRVLYGWVMSEDNNPHSLGLVMDLGIFGVAYTMNKKNVWWKAASYILIGMFIYVIVGCGSRKCLIAAVIISMLWLLPQIRETYSKGSTAIRFGVIMAIIAGIVLLVFYYRNVYMHSFTYERMQILGDVSNESGSSAKREYFYKVAFNLFMEYPFFGVGYEQFRFYNMYTAIAHSTYAEAIACWGFIGSMTYFVPVAVAGVKTMKMVFNKQGSYVTRIVLALWAMEIFLGIGQIWFYTVEHLIAWTVVFLMVKIQYESVSMPERKCKYVRD